MPKHPKDKGVSPALLRLVEAMLMPLDQAAGRHTPADQRRYWQLIAIAVQHRLEALRADS